MENGDKQSVDFGGALRLEEFIKYNQYHMKNFNNRFMISSFIFCILFFSLMDLQIGFLSLLFMSLITVVITRFLIINKITEIRSKKEYESDKILQNEIRYIADEDGINQKVKRTNFLFEWEDILLIKKYNDLYCLYVSKNKAIVIPIRYFDSEKEIQIFEKIINDNFPAEKVKNCA